MWYVKAERNKTTVNIPAWLEGRPGAVAMEKHLKRFGWKTKIWNSEATK
jgi:hypothetical protein